MRSNELCGLDHNGSGTYTTVGITKLCEGLKGSAVTSLECATALERPLLRQALLAPDPTSEKKRCVVGWAVILITFCYFLLLHVASY